MKDDGVFVNRHKEMEELMKIYAKVKEGYGRTVFVLGEPGIGKTYFCEKFCSMVEGATVLRGFASEDFTQPYQPINLAIGEYFEMARDVGEAELGRITEIIKKKHPQISGSEDIILNFLSAAYAVTKNGHEDMQSSRMRMFEIVSRLIHSIASEHPLVLFVEDLHWADKSTWNLIHYIARSIENRKVLLLGTYRNDETVDSRTGETRPIVDATQRMRRERLFTEILLGRFNEKESAEFIEKYTGVKPPEMVMKNLYSITEGVPLLLKEFSEYVLHDEKFFDVVPEDYSASVLNRLGKLSDLERKVVQVCAVIGERIDMEILMNFFSIDEEKLLEYLEKFCKINLLTEISSNVYKFSHNLLRKTVYRDIKDVRDMHLRVASVMETMPKYRDHRPATLGYHYLEGNEIKRAAVYYVRAGELALNNYALEEAKKYLENAIEIFENQQVGVDNRIQIALALMNVGNIDMDTGKLDEAKKSYDRVLRLAFELNSRKLASEAYRKIGKIFETKGNYDSAFAHYRKALETAIECRDLLSIAHAYEALGIYCWRVDKLEDAEKFFKACLETSSELDDRILIARAHTGLGNIDFKVGKYEDALVHFENAMNTLPEKEIPERLRNINNIAVVLTLIEKYEDAKMKYMEIVKEGEKYGLIRNIAYAYANLAAIYAEQNLFDEAIVAGEKGAEYAKKINDLYCMTMAKTTMARAMGKKGEIERFRTVVNESISLFEELGLHYDVAALYFDAADTMYYLQRFEEGNEYLKKSLEIGRKIGAQGIIKKLEEVKQKYGDKIKI
ncbi:MAG: tetratricopeptide repeat protein [Thermoplasmata archaeon]|nr:tetratricopeptide repeat protein [Thermoplasmata archaeon]